MKTGKRLLWVAALFTAGTLFADVVIQQQPRDLPSYPAARQSFADVTTKVAVSPLPVAGTLLENALQGDGCRVVAAVPKCGCGPKDRPDCLLEPISLISKTERNGASVNLVTVLIVRVRRPTSLGETAQGRTFQGASRIHLGIRSVNSRGETETSEQEIADGVRQAVANLLRIPALKTAIAQMR